MTGSQPPGRARRRRSLTGEGKRRNIYSATLAISSQKQAVKHSFQRLYNELSTVSKNQIVDIKYSIQVKQFRKHTKSTH